MRSMIRFKLAESVGNRFRFGCGVAITTAHRCRTVTIPSRSKPVPFSGQSAKINSKPTARINGNGPRIGNSDADSDATSASLDQRRPDSVRTLPVGTGDGSSMKGLALNHRRNPSQPEAAPTKRNQKTRENDPDDAAHRPVDPPVRLPPAILIHQHQPRRSIVLIHSFELMHRQLHPANNNNNSNNYQLGRLSEQ